MRKKKWMQVDLDRTTIKTSCLLLFSIFFMLFCGLLCFYLISVTFLYYFQYLLLYYTNLWVFVQFWRKHFGAFTENFELSFCKRNLHLFLISSYLHFQSIFPNFYREIVVSTLWNSLLLLGFEIYFSFSNLLKVLSMQPFLSKSV